MPPPRPSLRDLLSAHALQFWLGFAVHAALRFLLPPGLSAEVALMWMRHLVDAALLTPRTPRPLAA
jgi:hypothetical protein